MSVAKHGSFTSRQQKPEWTTVKHPKDTPLKEHGDPSGVEVPIERRVNIQSSPPHGQPSWFFNNLGSQQSTGGFGELIPLIEEDKNLSEKPGSIHLPPRNRRARMTSPTPIGESILMFILGRLLQDLCVYGQSKVLIASSSTSPPNICRPP